MMHLFHKQIPASSFDLLQLHELDPQHFPFLLQSVAHGNEQSRYDILFAYPGETLQLDKSHHLQESGNLSTNNGFLNRLDQRWQQEAKPQAKTLDLPFCGGWFLYLSYELAGEIEPVLQMPQAPGILPVALAVRIPAAVIYDHRQQCIELVAEDESLLSQLQQALDQLQGQSIPHAVQPIKVNRIVEAEAAQHLHGIERIQQYILEGDVFQVNLSRLWQVQVADDVSASELYRSLRCANPAPYAGLMQWQGGSVISSSPERLVSVKDRVVETRPIAGTRQRAEDPGEDQALSRELLKHPKERAEHIMLLDLERNDLGRVCVPGSVQVNEMMVLESYTHVHHIVSNVRGRLRDEITPGEVIRAVFPGGTITGCPKVRCMEILAELEQQGRGAYTGSMGYLNHNGDMDLNILIRTMEMAQNTIYLRAGGGIVADSDPQRELQETRTKAKGLLMSLQETP